MKSNYQEGIKQLQLKNYKIAIKHFLEYFEKADNDTKIGSCFYLSQCYSYLGDSTKQVFYLLKSFHYGTPRPEICCNIGYYFFNKKDFNTALYWYKLATTIEKKEFYTFILPIYWDYVPYMQISLCYYYQNDLEQAIKYSELATKLFPTSKAIAYNHTFFYKKLDENDVATLSLQKTKILKERKNLEMLDKPGVSLILPTKKDSFKPMIFENFNRMKYKKKELIIILNNNALKIEEYEALANGQSNIHIYQLDDSITLGECLNFGIDHAIYDYIAKIDDDDYYGENYLIDSMNVFLTTNADVTGKSRRFVYFEKDKTLWVFRGLGENKFTLGTAGGTIIAKKAVFEKVKFQALNLSEDDAFFLDCQKNGFNVYSNNKFNYLYYRHVNQSEHSFKNADRYYLDASTKIAFHNDPLTIINV